MRRNALCVETQVETLDWIMSHAAPSYNCGAPQNTYGQLKAKAPQPLSRYWISDDVSLCSSGGGIVVLDLKRDRYHGIDDPRARQLWRVVEGWPRSLAEPEPVPSDEDLLHTAQTLATRGLLSASPPRSAWPAPQSLPVQDLIGVGNELTVDCAVQRREIRHFVSAIVESLWFLHARSLRATVHHLARRKRHLAGKPNDVTFRDILSAVEAFRHLRPFAFTAREHCLFHAVTLVNFLARYNFAPTFVIGVRTAPFFAHSWAQHGNYILDANPGEVAFYTPILTI